MLFNSFEFIFVFLPITFLIYFYLNKRELTEVAKGFLVFASLFFYSWWNISYLPLILISMLFNYMIGRQLVKYDEKERRYNKKVLLIIGVCFNLLLLAYFKYSDFFISNFNLLFDSNFPLLHLALPLAISFYTFQQVAYLVDSYRNETKEYDFLNYAVFVAFFPQLIAGPIVHHAEMMPQFANMQNKIKNYYNIALGLFIFSIGLFKKIVIADTFATWATNGFDKAEVLNFIEGWFTSLSYTLQLYFDFSGYTDMAIGIALLFNIKLPINFNSPYKAISIQDFWRRWHMTLSRFLKDYLYIPLGGNRKGEVRTYLNLFITFLLGGIWHGAGWTFVFWGALHGFALVVHRFWQKLGFRMHAFVAWFITFNFINVTWVFFRAREWDDALKVLKGMVSVDQIYFPAVLSGKLHFMENYGINFSNAWAKQIGADFVSFIWLIIGLVLVLFFKNSNEMAHNFKVSYRTVWFSAIAFVVSILSLNKVSEFLYFNF